MDTAPSFDTLLKSYIEQIAFAVARRVVNEHRCEIDDLIKTISEQRHYIADVVKAVQESGTFEQAVYDACNALIKHDEALSDTLDRRITKAVNAAVSMSALDAEEIRETVRDVLRNEAVLSIDIE